MTVEIEGWIASCISEPDSDEIIQLGTLVIDVLGRQGAPDTMHVGVFHDVHDDPKKDPGHTYDEVIAFWSGDGDERAVREALASDMREANDGLANVDENVDEEFPNVSSAAPTEPAVLQVASSMVEQKREYKYASDRAARYYVTLNFGAGPHQANAQSIELEISKDIYDSVNVGDWLKLTP